LRTLQEHFVLKEVTDPGSSGQRYLGATIGKYTSVLLGNTTWYMSLEEYLARVILTVEAEWDEKLYKKASSLKGDYHPELNMSPLLSEDDAQLYGSYIGILQWAVKLAQIDLMQSISLMVQFQNAP